MGMGMGIWLRSTKHVFTDHWRGTLAGCHIATRGVHHPSVSFLARFNFLDAIAREQQDETMLEVDWREYLYLPRLPMSVHGPITTGAGLLLLD
jgi:hypothetical protein